MQNCHTSIMLTLATRCRWAFSNVQWCFCVSVSISSVPVVGRNSYDWILPGLDCTNAIPRLRQASLTSFPIHSSLPQSLILSHLLYCEETVVSVLWHNGLNQGIIMFFFSLSVQINFFIFIHIIKILVSKLRAHQMRYSDYKFRWVSYTL